MKRLVKHRQLKPLAELKKEVMRENMENDEEFKSQVSLTEAQLKELADKEDEGYRPRPPTPDSPNSDDEKAERKRIEREKKIKDIEKQIEDEKREAELKKGFHLGIDLQKKPPTEVYLKVASKKTKGDD